MYKRQDVKRPKPAPDLFLHAARSCGASPENCLVIEDSLTGVAAAKAANMQVFYLSAAGDILDGAKTIRHPNEISL